MNPFKALLIAVSVACLCTVAESCTPSESGKEEENETTKTAPIHGTHSIAISEMKFIPAELYAKQGDTVVFVNMDVVTHDITEEASKAWSSSMLPTKQSWSMVVSQSSNYYCSLHPVMKGKIVME